MKKIAIFASGSGSNAENIINYFSENKDINIELILSNKINAFVLERAKKHNIETNIFNREDFYSTDKILDTLQEKNIDYIILAGFLWLVPPNILSAFENKVINIHPALLPKYGGKGMYGNNIHKAVIKNQDRKTGITIHFVNEKYDEGNIIFQIECGVSRNDTFKTIAKKVLKLEHEFFPKIIEEIITK